MVKALLLVVLLAVAHSYMHIGNRVGRRALSARTYRQRPLRAEAEDGKTEGEARPSRPPVIPFEFAREDRVPKVEKTEKTERVEAEERREVVTRMVPVLFDEDPERPTGYNTPDVDEYDTLPPEGYEYESAEKDNQAMRFLKEVYIGSPYDSRKKKQARYVIKNITGISIAIGVVFTAVWYLFPGKFISYRGTTNFSERYSQQYTNPTGLEDGFGNLNPDPTDPSNNPSFNNPNNPRPYGSMYFDESAPPPTEQTRFALPQAPPALAPGRTVDL